MGTISNEPVRRRGRRRIDEGPALDRERLIEALIAIARDDGIAAINMRRLASDLNISTRLLYHHVQDKEDMLLLLFDEILARNIPKLEGLAWEDVLRTIASATRSAYTPYHGMAAEILARSADVVLQPSALLMRNALMRALAEAGLAEEEVELAYIQFSIIVLGGLTMQENLNLRGARLAIARGRIDKSIDMGLDLLIFGIRRHAARNRQDSSDSSAAPIILRQVPAKPAARRRARP